MIWTLLNLMLGRGLTMKRWNNFPRIEEVSHLDNLGFVIHVALFLSYLEEKKWKKVDKLFLIKRLIFSSFNRLILADINSGTREYILSLDKEIFKRLEGKALEKILELNGPEIIKDDIKDTLNDDSKELELLIIEAAKKYAGLRECTINARVYSEVYEKTFNVIKQDLEKTRTKLLSLDELLWNEDFEKYLSHVRGLSHSFRWIQENRLFPVSVMSHLVYVTFISYVIWTLENEDWAELDMEELLLKSIYHDIPEAITWDIITPTKKAIPGFVEILEQVELKMMEDYMFWYVPEDYKNKISEYIFAPFDDELWKIAKYSDIFSALFEAKIEINNGNLAFKDMYLNIKNKANSFGLTSTDYLVKYWIDKFDEDKKLFV